jgi:predicted MFS family arabinose efflux permease
LQLYRASFRGLPREVWILCIALLVNRAGTMVMPFLSLFLIRSRSFSEGQVAMALVSFGVGSVVGSYVAGRLCQRWGALAVMKVTLVSAGLTFLILPWLESYPAWIAGLGIGSLFGEGFRPGVMTAVSAAAPVEVRTRSLALLRLAANLGLTIGPAVGGFLASWNYSWLFFADGATSLLAALWLQQAFRGRQRRASFASSAAPSGSLAGSALKDRSFLALIAVVFLFACVLFQLLGAFPLHLRDFYGLGEREIGLLFGLNGLLIVLFEMPLVRSLERFPEGRLLGVGTLLLCTGFALLPAGSTFGFVAFTVVIWTLGEMVGLPFSNTLVARLAGDRVGEYMGVYTATFSLALLIAPALGIWTYHHSGPTVLWMSAGALGPLGCLLSWRGVGRTSWGARR